MYIYENTRFFNIESKNVETQHNDLWNDEFKWELNTTILFKVWKKGISCEHRDEAEEKEETSLPTALSRKVPRK